MVIVLDMVIFFIFQFWTFGDSIYSRVIEAISQMSSVLGYFEIFAFDWDIDGQETTFSYIYGSHPNSHFEMRFQEDVLKA